MEKKKLTLNKSVISKLTKAELAKVIGGDEDLIGSSRSDCTGFLCCDPVDISVNSPLCDPGFTSPQRSCATSSACD